MVTPEEAQAFVEGLDPVERRTRAFKFAVFELGHILRPDDFPEGPLPYTPDPDNWWKAWEPYVEEAKRALGH